MMLGPLARLQIRLQLGKLISDVLSALMLAVVDDFFTLSSSQLESEAVFWNSAILQFIFYNNNMGMLACICAMRSALCKLRPKDAKTACLCLCNEQFQGSRILARDLRTMVWQSCPESLAVCRGLLCSLDLAVNVESRATTPAVKRSP